MGRRPKRGHVDVDGLLLVDKPAGMTSHDVVHKIRRHFDLAKVGHGGTLDPMATGLLVLLLGKGTKRSDWVMGNDKAYEGEITLGVRTHTQDAEGEILETRDVSGITEEQVRKAFAVWQGDVEQIPPMVSALKKGGQALYKLAREGKEVEREPRPVRILEMDVLEVSVPKARFRLRCSKGTYVRTLCHDVGASLGCGGHLSALRRTSSGTFQVDHARGLDALLGMDLDGLRESVIPLESLPPWPQ